jgi:hypothetical protein
MHGVPGRAPTQTSIAYCKSQRRSLLDCTKTNYLYYCLYDVQSRSSHSIKSLVRTVPVRTVGPYLLTVKVDY